MAQLNGIDYEDWKEYINTKFPSEIFNISIEQIDSVTTYTITTKDPASKTKIYLELFDGTALRPTFDHPESPLSIEIGEDERKRAVLYADYTLKDDELLIIDNYINIPLYFGWTDRKTFYRNKVLREELLFNNAGKWEHFHIHTYYWSWYEKFGCLLILFIFPVLWIESIIVRNRIKRGKEILVETKEIIPMLSR